MSDHRPEASGGDVLELAPHYYGGQAVIEGVMMRGADRWAVAVRRPTGDVWLECHPTSSLPRRYPALARPLLRGCYALVDSLSIGMRALSVAATQAMEEDEREDLGDAAVGASMLMALVIFVGVFIFLPSAATKGLDALVGGVMGDGVWFHLTESLVRIGIFLGYLWLISLMGDIRRVFQYHGAEHKTIAAWEAGETLEPGRVDRYSTLHVRCGTNFLILVMLLAVVVYTVGGVLVPPEAVFGAEVPWHLAVLYHVLLRVALLPLVAGLAYEGLRLGARFGDHLLVRAVMRPGLWLQLITTKPPSRDQIEVAIRAFEAVVPAGQRQGRVPDGLPSPVTLAPEGLEVSLTDAETRVERPQAPGDEPSERRDGA